MPDTNGAAPIQPVTTAEITDEIWLEVARRHAEGHSARHLVQQPASTVAPALPPLPLPALLALDGTDFIEAAYATVLGRPADAAGLAHLSAELASGREKTELLRNLQDSPEGRQAGRFIDGLPEQVSGRRLSRFSVLGTVARMSRAGVRRLLLPSAQHNQPASPARAEAQLASLEAGLDAWRGAMEGQLIDHRLAVDTVTRRLATVQAAQEELGRKTLKEMAEQGTMLASLTERSAAFARQLAATEDSVIDSMLALADSVASHEARLTVMEGEPIGPRIAAAITTLRSELESRVADAEAMATQASRDVAEHQRRTVEFLAPPGPAPGDTAH